MPNKPFFTAENARANQAKAVQSQRNKRDLALALKSAELAKALNLVPVQPSQPEDTRRTRLEQQLDELSIDIRQAHLAGKVGLKLRLMQAQLSLWRVLYPAPGALKPKTSKALPQAIELPDSGLVSHEVSHDPSSSSISSVESDT